MEKVSPLAQSAKRPTPACSSEHRFLSRNSGSDSVSGMYEQGDGHRRNSMMSQLSPVGVAEETTPFAPSDHRTHFEHDFSGVPLHSVSQGNVSSAPLAISQPGDAHELEANRIASQVMRMPDLATQTQQSPSDGLKTSHVPPILHEVLHSSGQPLDTSTRLWMEPRFGYDFSNVRVHTGRKAEESARSVHAQAYVVGRDIVFGEGQYAPMTTEGNKLMAHELVHVIQQTGLAGMVHGSSVRPVASVVSRQSDADEAKRVADLKANYEAAVKSRDWKKAALYLNGFNEDDILARLAKLSNAELVAMRYGALKSMPGFSDRLTNYIDKKFPQAAKKIFKDDLPLVATLGDYGFTHDLIGDATSKEKADLLADKVSLKKVSDAVTANDFAKLVELLGRQAPTVKELMADAFVKGALDEAWKASNVPAGLGKRHEEGGYILMDLLTGQLSRLKAKPGPTGTLLAMKLPDVTPPRGQIVVAHFHTHPNPEAGFAQECSTGEPESFDADGVPGLIRSAKGTFFCGPERRAHLGGWRGLPGPSGGDAP